MENPVIIKKPTPNGGDYSELWLFNDEGKLAETKEEATNFRLLELTNNGKIVHELYGTMDK